MLLFALAPLAVLMPLAEAAAGAVEDKPPPIIDLDGTVLVQFAIFVVMYVVLRQFLFKPYLRMRQSRESHIQGAEKKARDLEQRRESIEAEYQMRMQKARAGADEERMRMQAEARTREADVLGQARTRAQQRLAEAQAKIAAQVATAQAALEKQAEPLARSLLQKLLRREI